MTLLFTYHRTNFLCHQWSLAQKLVPLVACLRTGSLMFEVVVCIGSRLDLAVGMPIWVRVVNSSASAWTTIGSCRWVDFDFSRKNLELDWTQTAFLGQHFYRVAPMTHPSFLRLHMVSLASSGFFAAFCFEKLGFDRSLGCSGLKLYCSPDSDCSFTGVSELTAPVLESSAPCYKSL